MLGRMRKDVNKWLNRPLVVRYPIVFIDAIGVKVRRPTESATGWGLLMDRLAERGLRQVDRFVANGLYGLAPELARRLTAARVNRYVVYIKRQLIARVRPSDKAALAGVFRIDDPHDSIEAGWQRWGAMCRRWGERYTYCHRLSDNPNYMHAFTYLNFDSRMRSMI